jgi:hypothetical protein
MAMVMDERQALLFRFHKKYHLRSAMCRCQYNGRGDQGTTTFGFHISIGQDDHGRESVATRIFSTNNAWIHGWFFL